MKSFYVHITASDVHYFMLVCLSGGMRSSYADKRGFSVFIYWANVHIDARFSYTPTRKLPRRLYRLQTAGRRHQLDSDFMKLYEKLRGSSWKQRAAKSTAAVTSAVCVCHLLHTSWLCDRWCTLNLKPLFIHYIFPSCSNIKSLNDTLY